MDETANAEERARRLIEMKEPERAGMLRGSAAFLAGHFAESVRQFATLRRGNDWVWKRVGWIGEANVRAELGRREQALELLQAGARAAEQAAERLFAADCHISIAWLHLESRRTAECRREAFQAANLTSSGFHLMRAGTILARSGAPDAAAGLLSRLPGHPSTHKERIYRLRLEGEIALARVRQGQAIALLEQASDLEPVMSDHEYLGLAYRTARRFAEATAVYTKIALAPGYLWRQPQRILPGFWAGCIRSALQLSELAGTPDGPALQSRAQFLRHADGLPPVQL
jgi:tetratricopeptide (TPR) repeat protein